MRSTAAGFEHTEEGRAFLQLRIGLFGLFGGAGFALFLSFRVVAVLLLDGASALLNPDMLYHGLAAACLFAVWLLCKSGTRSVGFLRTVETVGLLSATAATVAMGLSIPISPLNSPSMTVWGACTFGMATRAIYVPSTGRRTLVLTALAGVPVLLGTFLQINAIDPTGWAPEWPKMARIEPYKLATVTTIFTGVWWGLTVLLCTLASKVIYGLRIEASEARKMGQYTLDKKLGEGGMGEVFSAHHALLRRPTAIKLLHPEKAGAESIVRFEREVQLTAQLTHPNTVTIYDYGHTPDGVFYYAMELLDGATLEDVVASDGAQPPARVVHILSQVAEALNEAHGIGLIHRDIKPANIMLCRQGGRPDVAKVLDFGLVKDISADDDLGLTRPEAVTGTPLYMCPEAILNPSGMDARSDVYTLGAVGYYLLTGTHVFGGNSVVEVCANHLNAAPEPPGARLGAALPEGVSDLLLRCLEKKPEARPQSAQELLEQLRACDVDPPWSDARAEAWWRDTGVPDAEAEAKGDSNAATTGHSQTLLAVDLDARAVTVVDESR